MSSCSCKLLSSWFLVIVVAMSALYATLSCETWSMGTIRVGRRREFVADSSSWDVWNLSPLEPRFQARILRHFDFSVGLLYNINMITPFQMSAANRCGASNHSRLTSWKLNCHTSGLLELRILLYPRSSLESAMRTTAAIKKIRSQNVTLATEPATPSLKNLFQDCYVVQVPEFRPRKSLQSRNCQMHFCQALEHGVYFFRAEIQYSHGQVTSIAIAQHAPLSLSSPATWNCQPV